MTQSNQSLNRFIIGVFIHTLGGRTGGGGTGMMADGVGGSKLEAGTSTILGFNAGGGVPLTGAAVVVATMQAAARLAIPVNVAVDRKSVV